MAGRELHFLKGHVVGKPVGHHQGAEEKVEGLTGSWGDPSLALSKIGLLPSSGEVTARKQKACDRHGPCQSGLVEGQYFKSNSTSSPWVLPNSPSWLTALSIREVNGRIRL